jgi:hypothetical protein
MVAPANTAVTDDAYKPGRHYGLKVFGGANGKVMVIDTLGTFLAPLIGGSVAGAGCDSASVTSGCLSSSRSGARRKAVAPRDDDENSAAQSHFERGLSEEEQECEYDEVSEAVEAVEQRDQAIMGVVSERRGEGIEEGQRKEEDMQWRDRSEMEQEEEPASELSVLGALCGRFQLDMEDTLDRITYSCTCNIDGAAMNTADEAELLTQAKMLLEDATCDDTDDGEFELVAHCRGSSSSHWSNRYRSRYRCLIIHQPSLLLRDWSDASREDLLESVAACAISQGAAVCFVHDKEEDTVSLSEVTANIRYNISGTRSSKPVTGQVDKGRSVFSDLFDTTYSDPETDAAVAQTVETVIAVIEAASREEMKALKEEEAQAEMAAKISAAKQLLRVSEVRDRQAASEAAEGYAEEIAHTALASEYADPNL